MFHVNPDPVQFITETNSDGNHWGWNGPGWYYWDETWSMADGPFMTKEAAIKACNEYAQIL